MPSAVTKSQTFPIVAIGASAGGLEAFSELLSNLPTDTGMAFVLVQHLDPSHRSMLVDILGKLTGMPLVEVRNRMPIEADHVYIIPPNKNMTLVKGKFRLESRTESRGCHLPIDRFFHTLAQERGSQAIGIVLSGVGSDGVDGMKTIKDRHGITFAQTPESAKQDSMPNSAIATGCVDHILRPKQIAAKLVKLCRQLTLTDRRVPGVERLLVRTTDDLSKVFIILKHYTGVDFANYKKSTAERRIKRRLGLTRKGTLKQYVKYLRSKPEEVEILFQDMLINVTSFFRDPLLFKTLEKKIFPRILRQRPADQPVRVWVPACSTGEEAYSLAICILEVCRVSGKEGTRRVNVFATDVNAAVIEKARRGFYPESIKTNIPANILRRYFVNEAGGYRIVKSVRDMCVFAVQDLTRDAPFSRLDLISCRNMLIYMDHKLQKRIIPIFHYGLNSSGILVLGAAETVFSFADLFSPVDKKQKIYIKKEQAVRPIFNFEPGRYISSQSTAGKEHLQSDKERVIIPYERQPEGSWARDEELLSALEELQSANEELQSSNEELETSKEELQATNEELATLNDELVSRNFELAALNSDIVNLFNSTHMPLIMLGSDLCIRRFTPMAQKVWNVIPTDIGRKLADINPNVKVSHLEEMLLDAIDHLKTTEREVQDRDGHWYSMVVRPYKTVENKIDGAVITLADIHSIKIAQQKLEAIREYFENIVEAVPEALIVLDKRQRVRTANRSFYNQFKLAPKQAQGELIYELGNNQWDIPALRKLLKEVSSKETPVDDLEITQTFPHIGEKTLLLSIRSLVENIAGERLTLLGIKDITERKQAEETLNKAKEAAEDAAKAKSEFLNNIAHDFRTPMHAIMGFSSLLHAQQLTESQRKFVDIIYDKSRSLLELLEDLLDASRLDSVRFVLRSEEFDLQECVRTSFNVSQAALGDKAVKMSYSIADGIPRLKGDAVRLGQILSNLMDNAVKYTDQGEITVKVDCLKDNGLDSRCRIRLCVRDTGIGIPKGKQAQIFDAFTQYNEFSCGKERGGVGLGLYITKAIIDIMGGSISVLSDEGAGSEFIVTLDFDIAEAASA